MAKSAKRQKILAEKRARKANILKASGNSRYGKKASYLKKHQVFGFDVPEPKPWKSAR